MNAKLRKWMPIALCCLPGVAMAAIIGVGIALGGSAVGAFLSGSLGISLIVLAALACPLSMGLIMMRQQGASQRATSNTSQPMVDFCAPGEEPSEDHLSALRAQRESLERELASMQSTK